MKPCEEEEEDGGAAAAGGGGDPWQECVEVAVQLARRAGQIVRKALTEEKQVSTKTSAADLVTETDHFVENLIISVLKEKFPSHRGCVSLKYCMTSSYPCASVMEMSLALQCCAEINRGEKSGGLNY